jgi:hypothetical protein
VFAWLHGTRGERVELGIEAWRRCTYANEIGALFEEDNLMSYASQRDCTSETSSAAANDDKTNLEGRLLCGLMTTRLDVMGTYSQSIQVGKQRREVCTG